MAASSSSNPNPYDNYIQSPDPDLIDPDDLDVNDLDDPLDEQASARAPLTGGNIERAANAVPGEDRRATTNTLDESVWETLSRDLVAIWDKMKQVLYPRYTWSRWPDADTVLSSDQHVGIKDWDLWGPLVSALLLSLMLSIAASEKQRTIVFTGVFAIVWNGSLLVTLQIRLLGGNISFFQTVCVIGYTLFPIVIAAVLSAIHLYTFIRIPLYAVLFLWSLAAGVSILGGSGVVRNRVMLAVFPLGLFYFLLICLCLIS